MYQVSQKKVDLFGGLWDKKYVTDIQIKMLIYQGKAKLEEKTLFGKILNIFKTQQLEMCL